MRRSFESDTFSLCANFAGLQIVVGVCGFDVVEEPVHGGRYN